MCPPDHFDVVEVKNAFMEGQLGRVDRTRARAQWEALAATFARLGCKVATIPSVLGLEDMVFTANQALPGMGADGVPYVVLSNMRYPSRRAEVPHFERWYRDRGYSILRVEEALLEGQGDAIWHPGRQLLWGGYGHRTDRAAYDALSAMLRVPVVALQLPTDEFYHLDTCFSALDERTVLIYPDAFTPEGLGVIRHFFPRVIEASSHEARNLFACNAAAVDDRYVVLQRGASTLCRALRDAGFEPVEVDTSEFMKSGGSVFCMKVMIYDA